MTNNKITYRQVIEALEDLGVTHIRTQADENVVKLEKWFDGCVMYQIIDEPVVKDASIQLYFG